MWFELGPSNASLRWFVSIPGDAPTQVYMCTNVNTVCAALPGSGMEKVPLPQQTQVRNNIGNPPQMIDTCLVTKYSSGF